ncbi:MAG: hypothetical protein RMH75_01465 [Archaeoglobaceae archaeon]|nr:hypothetical protein [Archaeoglobaceae archaeon]MDW7989328.1 hypothetical protein [Archaeoglobaceae archaeon]
MRDISSPAIIAYSCGYSFITRAYAYHVKELKEIIKEAIKHRGSALIDILQPRVTYKDLMTRDWFEKRIYYVEQQLG